MMKKKIYHCFCLTTALCLSLSSQAQTPDSFRMAVCSQFWKNNASVPDLVLQIAPGVNAPTLIGYNANSSCGFLGFSPAANAEGFVPAGEKPSTNYNNGVTVADLIALGRHILGIQPFQHPAQFIAADINRSGSITTFDLVEQRKLILGIYNSFPSNTSWRLYWDGCVANPSNPFMGGPCNGYDYTPGEVADSVKLTAVKIGDVDGDANPLGLANPPGQDPSYSIIVPDLSVSAGDELVVPIAPGQNWNCAGFQLALRFDPAFCSILAIEAEALADASWPSSFSILPDGSVRVAWNETSSTSKVLLAGEPLFRVRVRAEQAFSLKNVIEKNVAGDFTDLLVAPNLDLHGFEDINFQTSTVEEPVAGVQVASPAPNPFRERTSIGLDLAGPEQVRLEVFDLTGKRVHFSEKEFGAGYQQFTLSGGDVPTDQTFIYRLSGQNWQSSGRLVHNN